MDSFERGHPAWPVDDSAENVIDNGFWDACTADGVPDGDMLPTEYAENAIAVHGGGGIDYEGLPADQHTDVIAARRSLLEEIGNSSGSSYTEEVPVRLETGYTSQMRLLRRLPELSAVLTEQPLQTRHELEIEAGENAFVRLGPGEEGAIATGRLTGCTTTAGIAHYADGSRSAYISHHTPGDDYALRGGPDGCQVLSARLMRQFNDDAAMRSGLERVSLAVVYQQGLPEFGQPGSVGRHIVEDTHAVAARLQDNDGVTVAVEPYQIAYAGGHSVTVHLGETCSTIYFNDRPIVEA